MPTTIRLIRHAGETTLFLASALHVGPASAAIAFDSFGPNNTFNASSGVVFYSNDVSAGFCGTQFVAASSGTLSSATFAISGSPEPVPFTMNVFSDLAGKPNQLLSSSSILVPGGSFSPRIFSGSFSASTTISAGNTYWFALNEVFIRLPETWYSNSIGNVGPVASFNNGAWTLSSTTTATPVFRLEVSPVPEVRTSALLVSGLVGLWLVALKNKQQTRRHEA